MRRKLATSGGEKQSDEWKFKEPKMRSNKIGVLDTVNVLKNKSKKDSMSLEEFCQLNRGEFLFGYEVNRLGFC